MKQIVLGCMLVLLGAACSTETAASSSAEVSLGSGPATVYLNGSNPGIVGSSIGSSGFASGSGINCSAIGLSSVDWTAQVYQDSNGKYNILYTITNNDSTHNIISVEISDFHHQGTIDVDYQSTSGNGHPNAATRSSGNASIVWDHHQMCSGPNCPTFCVVGGVNLVGGCQDHFIPPGGNTGKPYYVNATATSWGSVGTIIVHSDASPGGCTLTNTAPSPQ